jgi:hypothetical protein
LTHAVAPADSCALHALTRGQVHLAMGAWRETEDHPMCWQREMGQCEELRNWAIRTLQYLQDHLG